MQPAEQVIEMTTVYCKQIMISPVLWIAGGRAHAQFAVESNQFS